LGGTTQTIKWNVANTDNATGINVQNVDILMSTDGGLTYPTTILSNVPNVGSQSITVPNIATNSTVRFMVKASDNIFFDISDVNSTITFNPAQTATEGKFTLRLQPQPVHTTADLHVDGISKKNFTLIISDVIGRIIFKKEIDNNEESRVISLNLNGKASGLYLVRVVQDNKERTLKAIKL